MQTQAEEETQAKEFLKRAEIRTMKKDLAVLREGDALKERDKIASIKTLEEQLEEKNKSAVAASAKAGTEKVKREEILLKNEGQERIAEKDLKNYGTEQERQQIFLLESQRFELEKQVDQIDKEKDPALKLEKNSLLIKKREIQTKLDSVLEQEKKIEEEQKIIVEKAQTTTAPAERKGLEQTRWDFDKKIQDLEKKRWELEKQIGDVDGQVGRVDKSLEVNGIEKNGLRDKILGADKSLREIYSGIMAREEQRRRGAAQEQVARRETLSKARTEEKEKIQREQWSKLAVPQKKDFIQQTPLKQRIEKSFEAEKEQREKFIQDVEQATNKDINKNNG